MTQILERPDAAELIEIARATVLDELLPALPETHRLAARMVANALGIAKRMLDVEGVRLAGLEARAAAVVGEGEEPWRALCALIRSGAADPGCERHDTVAGLLADLARLRCETSAPKTLAGG
ncbi:MAG: DUF6285 domain-containing protein [Elioraea sp.]|nr:DUF6285 domain-containing protein [Elioraea sp.]MDW8443494.1 DUF6285 domain-containing protein [Acetobacteraceae bacterium]